MEICEEGHEAIVWQRSQWREPCPLCIMKKQLAEAREKIADLERQIEDLEAQ